MSMRQQSFSPTQTKRQTPTSTTDTNEPTRDVDPRMRKTQRFYQQQQQQQQQQSHYQSVPEYIAGYIHQCGIIGVDILQDVIAALHDARTTSTLDFSKTPQKINDPQIMCLASCVAASPWITALDLQNQSISVAGAMELGTILHQNRCITRINLAGNEIRSEGLLALASHLEKTSNLLEIGLASNSVGNHGAAGLARYLSNSACTLLQLDLRHNNIKQEGIERLAAALKTNEVLHTLNLRFNSIRDMGCIALGSCLMKNQSLTSLDIGANGISDEGARSLAAGLFVNKSLRKLNLRSNDIRNEGFNALLECLKRNNTLTALYIGNNKPTTDVCASLGLVLSLNSQLSQLDLQGLRIESPSIQNIADSLSSNMGIKEFVVDIPHELRDKFMTTLMRRWSNAYYVEINTASGKASGNPCTIRIHRDVPSASYDSTWNTSLHNTTIDQSVALGYVSQHSMNRHSTPELNGSTRSHANGTTPVISYSRAASAQSALQNLRHSENEFAKKPKSRTSRDSTNGEAEELGDHVSFVDHARASTQGSSAQLSPHSMRSGSAFQDLHSSQDASMIAQNSSRKPARQAFATPEQKSINASQPLSSSVRFSSPKSHQDIEPTTLLQLREQLMHQYSGFSQSVSEKIRQAQAEQQTFIERCKAQLQSYDDKNHTQLQKISDRIDSLARSHDQLGENQRRSLHELRAEQEQLFQGMQNQFNELLTHTEKELHTIRTQQRRNKSVDNPSAEHLEPIISQKLADMTEQMSTRVASILRPDFERALAQLSQQQSQAASELDGRLTQMQRRLASLEGRGSGHHHHHHHSQSHNTQRRTSPSRTSPSASAQANAHANSQAHATNHSISDAWGAKIESRVANIHRRMEILETAVRKEQAASMTALEALLRDSDTSRL